LARTDEELLKKIKTQFLKESIKMTRELKKGLIGKTIKNVEVSKYGGDVYIKLATDKGPIIIGANDLGVWIDRPENFRKSKREMLQF
jgi:ribosomal protein S3